MRRTVELGAKMHAINTKRKEELQVLDQRKLVLYLLFLQRVFEHQLIHN